MAITVQDVLDQLKEPVGNIPNTVDTLKYGDANMEVMGIATSFMPTYHVIQQAIAVGANLLITHEGLFYSHLDNTDLIKNDTVAYEKHRLIIESGIAIYRFHDTWHRYQPDGIMVGLVHALGWQPYVVKNYPTATILDIPKMNVKDIAEYVKRKLGIHFIRVSGDLSARCTRIGLLAGYRGGGALSIPLFEKENLDLIMYGEGPEWETPEYVRDTAFQGKNRAVIVLGHAESEEPGMKYLAEWLKTIYSDLPVCFISNDPIFQVI